MHIRTTLTSNRPTPFGVAPTPDVGICGCQGYLPVTFSKGVTERTLPTECQHGISYIDYDGTRAYVECGAAVTAIVYTSEGAYGSCTEHIDAFIDDAAALEANIAWDEGSHYGQITQADYDNAGRYQL